MPFGIFVGVNNHFQTAIFGCALLREETVEAFKWLFETFTEAMHGKRPSAILTGVFSSGLFSVLSHVLCCSM